MSTLHLDPLKSIMGNRAKITRIFIRKLYKKYNNSGLKVNESKQLGTWPEQLSKNKESFIETRAESAA